MNPLRITGRNWRTFRSFDVTLPDGACAIVGVNGAGKSTIASAVEIALFGPKTSMAGFLTRGIDEPTCSLELEFEHQGEAYRIRRTFTATGRGKTTLDFERSDPEGDPFPWTPLTATSTSATQERIDQVLGFTRDTFRASAYLAQGDSAAFTEAQPRERKRLLAEALGLDVWDGLLERVRPRRRACEEDLATLRAKIELRSHALENGDDPNVDELRRLLQAEKQRLGEREERRDELVGQLQAAKDAEHALVAAQQHAAHERENARRVEDGHQRALRAAEALETCHQARETAERLSARLPEIREENERKHAEVREWEAAHREFRLAEAERAAFDGERARLQAQIDALENAEVVTCKTCGSVLNEDTRRTAAAAYGQEMERIMQKLAERSIEPPGEKPQHVFEDDSAARDAAAEVARLDERISQFRAQVAEGPSEALLAETQRKADEAAARVKLLEPTIDETLLTGLRHELDDTNLAIAGGRELCERLQGDVGRAEAEMAQRSKWRDELRVLQEDQRTTTERLDLYRLAEAAYSRDGVPALVVEAVAVPAIETEANRILEELETPFTVELRTQRETTTGSVSETLDIVVQEPNGEAEYATFSGGERTRLNVALRVGLARLLAHRKGAEIGLLALDEPEFLDASGLLALAGVLERLQGDFAKVVLISHDDLLVDRFERVIEVRKDAEGRSEVAA